METTTVEIRTGDREQVVDLTRRAEDFLREVGAVDGLLHVFVPHATAGVAVIETGAGSDDDLLAALRSVLPPSGPSGSGWTHRHGSPGRGGGPAPPPARLAGARARPRPARPGPPVRLASRRGRPAGPRHLAERGGRRHERRQPGP